jgi:hypothetical protein
MRGLDTPKTSFFNVWCGTESAVAFADVACLEPIGQSVQIWRKHGETADRLWVRG